MLLNWKISFAIRKVMYQCWQFQTWPRISLSDAKLKTLLNLMRFTFPLQPIFKLLVSYLLHVFLVIGYPLFLHWYKNFKKYKYTSPDDEGEFFFNVALVCQKKCFVIDKAILKETIRLFMAGSHLLLNTKWWNEDLASSYPVLSILWAILTTSNGVLLVISRL